MCHPHDVDFCYANAQQREVILQFIRELLKLEVVQYVTVRHNSNIMDIVSKGVSN